MWLNPLNTQIASEVGNALADHFLAVAPGRTGEHWQSPSSRQVEAIRALLAQVDREARPLRLGLFRRTRLANSFRWRLLDSGVEDALAEELTRMLLSRLSSSGSDPTPDNQPAPAADAGPEPDSDSGSVRSLLARIEAGVARDAHAEVIECCRQLLKLKPRHLAARNNLGVALWKLGRYTEAAEQFRRAVSVQPAYADAQFNLGCLLRVTGRVAESEGPLRRALKLNPRHIEAQVNLATTLLLLGRLRDAREFFEKALKTAPRDPAAWVGLGKIASLEGRFDEAESLIRRALAVDANLPAAWAALVDLRRMTSSDGASLKEAEKAAAGAIEPLEEADLRFAIGKYCDDTGDSERAFRSFQRANELQRRAAPAYDGAAMTRFVDRTIRVYTREALAAVESDRSDSLKPVFVVGMMRSGTSLVEHVISSHPAAHGAGELSFWSDAAAKLEGVTQDQVPGPSTRKKLTEAYLRTLGAISPGALRMVDKANFNSDHLGLIHAVFPNARMIYVQRDPVDACLSCYFSQFSPTLNFKLDLSDLAHYYREHRRLVAHWRSVLPPGTLLDVRYEDLVDDQEKWTRKILDFIGLEWHERCLEFHTVERPVLTASFWQVRQKIYNRAVGRSKRYEKFIGPLRDLRELA